MKTTYETVRSMLLNACEQTLRIIEKAEALVATGSVTEEALLSARIAPDMFPLTRQIQIVSDNVKNGVARLAGVEAPSMPDTEATFAELKARIEATRAFASGITPEAMNAGATAKINLRWMPEGMYFAGEDYALQYIVQNTLFHVVTAYDIVRMNGGALGKSDYIGQMPMHS